MTAFVVTGTDTDVGKTVFAAALTGALDAHYWKPVQAGLDDGVGELVGRDAAIGAGRQPGDLAAFRLEGHGGIDDGLVLDDRRHQVTPPSAIGPHEADQRQVVGLGGPTGPDDLPGIGADQVGDLAAGVFHRFFRQPAVQMAA